MYTVKSAALFQRFDVLELNLCLFCNRACHREHVRRFFAVVSRLGDGVFWYVLILMLPVLFGRQAIAVSLHMAAVGGVGVLVYKALKARLVRERPFIQHASIARGTAPLDQYSFPSGHTLHAVAFSSVAVAYFPILAWLVLPFACLVAVSRVALGLHYPSDVLVGALLGALVAATSFSL